MNGKTQFSANTRTTGRATGSSGSTAPASASSTPRFTSTRRFGLAARHDRGGYGSRVRTPGSRGGPHGLSSLPRRGRSCSLPARRTGRHSRFSRTLLRGGGRDPDDRLRPRPRRPYRFYIAGAEAISDPRRPRQGTPPRRGAAQQRGHRRPLARRVAAALAARGAKTPAATRVSRPRGEVRHLAITLRRAGAGPTARRSRPRRSSARCSWSQPVAPPTRRRRTPCATSQHFTSLLAELI